MTLGWDRNPAQDITGYIVYYGTTSGFYTTAIDVGNNTTQTISGLVEGKVYYFVVSAYNSARLESNFSQELRYQYYSNVSPTLDPIGNIILYEDSGPHTVNLRGISSGASNETQTLTVTATVDHPGVISDPIISYVSPNSAGALTFSPLPNASGSVTVTVTVNDGQAVRNLTNQSFTVSVYPLNDPPVISSVPNQTISKYTSTAPIQFTVGDVETPAANLVLSAGSSNPILVPLTQITLEGNGANRTVKITPIPGLTGSALITVIVSDGVATASSAFTVTVTDNAPTPKIVSTSSTPSTGLTLSWASVIGGRYRIAYKNQLIDPTWTDLSSDVVANGFITSWTDPTFGRFPSRFYKVRPLP